MPSWGEVLREVQLHTPHDYLRNEYLQGVAAQTNRNILIYYSGWLQKGNLQTDFGITDDDKNGFMACCPKKGERAKGLDLILHTPGGDVAATESIIDYLHDLYKGDIRAFIPQLAMSGGTLIATSCKVIVMGRQSSIGPVDPQINGVAAQSYISEFNKACEQVKRDPSSFPAWQLIIGKLSPGFLITCQNAIDWSNEILSTSLERCMLKGKRDKKEKIKKILTLLGDQTVSKAHNRHISREQAKSAGLVIEDLGNDNKLQDLILSLHHLLGITFEQTSAVKIIANDRGAAYIRQANPLKG